MTTEERRIQPLPASIVAVTPRTKRGFYSLLQFEPSKYRQERVNIAILLEGPDVGYMGAKRLRHMERLLQMIDPLVDLQLARGFAQEFEENFRRAEPEPNMSLLGFEGERPKPSNLLTWQRKLERYRHTPFRLSDPKPLVFDQSLSFDSQLLSLYETMVARPRLDNQSEERRKKEYVRREATQSLRRFIDVEIDPPEIKGLRFSDHSFDAAQKLGRERRKYFEFSSFDILQPTTTAVRLFLQSVEDVTDPSAKEEGREHLSKDDFYFIFQPPQTGNAQAQKVADIALKYVEDSGIRAVQLGPAVTRLGESLAHPSEAAD